MSGADRAGRQVSVIIPAHNAADTIAEQLASLAEQERPGVEVVVVLNRCSDQTARVVGEFETSLPGLRSVVADERAGASYARNVGARSATGDALLFCDADDIVAAGWIDALVDALDRADVVGGRLEPLPGGDPRVLELFPVYRSVQRDALASYHGLSYAMTASMACTRRAFELAGGFDERFGHGCDDVVFALRVQRAGLRVAFVPTAVCAYRLRADIDELVRQRQSYARANVLYERVMAPAYSRPVSVEAVLFVLLALGATLCMPGVRRERRRVHRRVQWARLRESVALATSRRADSTTKGSTVPGFAASVAQTFPALRRWWPFRVSWTAWTDRAPLVDVTMPPATPTVGGLGFRVPFGVTMTQREELLPAIDDLGGASPTMVPGDNVVVLHAGVGVRAVAAVFAVSPGGDVTAVEASPILADACDENLRRHAPDDVTWRVVPDLQCSPCDGRPGQHLNG